MISYTPKSKYSWFLYLNGQLFADLTGIAENRKFSQTRNDSDDISFTVSIDKVNDLCSRLHVNIADLFQAGVTEIRVLRNNIPLVAGELAPWNGQVGGDRKLNLQCKGWFDLLKARRTSASYTSKSALYITQDLVNTTLARTYGSSGNFNGLQIGSVPAADSTTIYGVSEPLVYDQKTLYDAITEMANETNGFDFEMTWDKRLNIYYPHIGVQRPDIVFTYPGNLKDFQPSVDPTKMFNSLTARGKGSGGLDQLQVTIGDTLTQQKYGLREDVIDYANVTDSTLLTNLAQADLNIYKQPLVIQKVMFDGSGRMNAPQVGTFHIGDLVKVYITNFGLYPNINQWYMMDKIEVTINEGDSEDVTVTVADPYLATSGI